MECLNVSTDARERAWSMVEDVKLLKTLFLGSLLPVSLFPLQTLDAEEFDHLISCTQQCSYFNASTIAL